MAIIKKEKREIPKLTELVVADRLARNFDMFRNKIFTNAYFAGGEMDVAVITPARYLWEIEVKLTLADWKNDEKKSKWIHPDRKYISRFYYAVPRKLAEKIPEFVPAEAGILSINYHDYYNGWFVEEHRAPGGRRGEKITDRIFAAFMYKIYCKYWSRRMVDSHSKKEYDGSLEDL